MGTETETAAPAAPVLNKIETADALRAAYPALTAQLMTAARMEGATAERDRILGIEKIAVPGHENLVDAMKADGKSTPADVAFAILGAEKQTRSTALSAIASVESVTGKVAPAASSEPPAGKTEAATTPDGWKLEFEKSEALRAEFGAVENYVAFKKADQSGQARIKRS